MQHLGALAGGHELQASRGVLWRALLLLLPLLGMEELPAGLQAGAEAAQAGPAAGTEGAEGADVAGAETGAALPLPFSGEAGEACEPAYAADVVAAELQRAVEALERAAARLGAAGAAWQRRLAERMLLGLARMQARCRLPDEPMKALVVCLLELQDRDDLRDADALLCGVRPGAGGAGACFKGVRRNHAGARACKGFPGRAGVCIGRAELSAAMPGPDERSSGPGARAPAPAPSPALPSRSPRPAPPRPAPPCRPTCSFPSHCPAPPLPAVPPAAAPPAAAVCLRGAAVRPGLLHTRRPGQRCGAGASRVHASSSGGLREAWGQRQQRTSAPAGWHRAAASRLGSSTAPSGRRACNHRQLRALAWESRGVDAQLDSGAGQLSWTVVLASSALTHALPSSSPACPAWRVAQAPRHSRSSAASCTRA